MLIIMDKNDTKETLSVLKSAVVLEVEMYSDRQIADWDIADRLTANGKSSVLEKVYTKQ